MWKSTAECQSAADIEAMVPEKVFGPEESDGAHQLAAAKSAATALAMPFPCSVTLQGSGMSYPTSRVTVEVDGTVGASGETWEAAGDALGAPEIGNVELTDPTDDPGVGAALAAGRDAAVTLIESASIGNRDVPYRVKLEGDTGDPFMTLVEVSRAVKGEYDEGESAQAASTQGDSTQVTDATAGTGETAPPTSSSGDASSG